MTNKSFNANNGNTQGATSTAITESLSGESVILTSEADKLLFLDFVFKTLLESDSYSASDYDKWSQICGIVYGFMPDNEEALKKLDSFCQNYNGYVSTDDVRTKWKTANYDMASTPQKAEKQLWKLLEEHKSDKLIISVDRAFEIFKSKHQSSNNFVSNGQRQGTNNESYFNYDSSASPIDQAKAQITAMFDKSNLFNSYIGFAKVFNERRKFYPAKAFPFDSLDLKQPSQIIINPLKDAKYDKARNDQVSAYLYTLLESDNLSLEQQKNILEKENIPAVAIYFSGSKSIHVLVKINATSYKEYTERVNDLHDYLNKKYAALSDKPIFDSQCKHYAHLCRISGCINEKTGKQVQLLAINTGYSDYNEWKEKREPLSTNENTSFEAFLKESSISLTLDYDPEEAFKQGKVLMGNKYLMRGSSLFINAYSAAGKSSLAMHFALCLATGSSFFGISVIHPTKTILISAENDRDELKANFASMYQHSFSNYSLKDLKANLHYYDGNNLSPSDFFQTLEQLIKHHKAEVVIIDPLFAFFTGNIKDQEAVSEFTRNKLQSLLTKYNCSAILTHHKKKPTDKDLEDLFIMKDYSGMGSSDLTNWTRAVMTLDPLSYKNPSDIFVLSLAKRGEKAGLGGMRNIYLKRSPNPNNPYWEQTEAPIDLKKGRDRAAYSKYEELYDMQELNADDFKEVVCRKFNWSEDQYRRVYRNAIVPRYVVYKPETKTYIGFRKANSSWYQPSSSSSKLSKEEEDQNKTVEQLIYEIKSEQAQQQQKSA